MRSSGSESFVTVLELSNCHSERLTLGRHRTRLLGSTDLEHLLLHFLPQPKYASTTVSNYSLTSPENSSENWNHAVHKKKWFPLSRRGVTDSRDSSNMNPRSRPYDDNMRSSKYYNNYSNHHSNNHHNNHHHHHNHSNHHG